MDSLNEDIKILRAIQKGFSSYNDFVVMEAGERQIQAIENLIKAYKEQDKAMTYMLQDLEVERKGYTIEGMKNSYMVRAKSFYKEILEG